MIGQTKVAHVVLSLQPGGLERLVCTLVSSPVLSTLPTIVVCLDEPGVLAPLAAQSGCRILLVKRKPGLDLGLIRRLAKVLKREGVTVVHTHSLDPMLYAGWAAWWTSVAVRIHTQHDIWLRTYNWKDRLKFRVASRFFHKIVGVSEDTTRSFAQYGISSPKGLTILNGIEDKKFSRSHRVKSVAVPEESGSRNPKEWVVGTVARLSPEKGIHHLLHAHAILRLRGLPMRLVVVGEGPQRGELEMLARTLGLSTTVEFMGYQEHVETFLSTFDLFVLPSISEGIPLSLLEAMANGLPVVATNVGGIPEVVVHQESGLLVPSGQPDTLAQALEQLIQDPCEAERIAKNGECRIRERFGMTAMSEAYLYLYGGEPPTPFLKNIVKACLRMFPRRWMLWKGKGTIRHIAITFDDGPDLIYTPQILEVLKAYGVTATFFLVGEKIEQHKEMVRRIFDEGHELGNHSYTHPSFDFLSWKESVGEIEKTQFLLRAITGHPCQSFRPPFGKLCLGSIVGAWLANMTCVMWNVDLKDFQATSSGEILAALQCQSLRSGDVLLYHGTNPSAVKALPAILDLIVRKGMHPVHISKMLSV
ncbi:glycosyltransferase [uncultured Nitrospira sp.]|uniref:glycosyltransferase n=1 Tax=uncultured Nitrospira sp. TaxID=157176 RepID=UPI00314045C9